LELQHFPQTQFPHTSFVVFVNQKCSKPSASNTGFETDYIKSLSDPIPLDFYFYVPESQNAPNHHHLLLQIMVLGMTTKNRSPTEFL
jgi:hypothetical protein